MSAAEGYDEREKLILFPDCPRDFFIRLGFDVAMSDIIVMNTVARAIGRTVRLFLAEGRPQGIVVADVGNWNGKALAAPRGQLPELMRRPEASRTGIYIMLGPDPEQDNGLFAYIGEADDIAAGMRIHLRSESKDFFDRVLLLDSSDEMLTKGHVWYLESRLIKLTQDGGSVELTNDTHPDFQRLPEADRADIDTFVETPPLCCRSWGVTCFGAGNSHGRSPGRSCPPRRG